MCTLHNVYESIIKVKDCNQRVFQCTFSFLFKKWKYLYSIHTFYLGYYKREKVMFRRV